MGVTVRFRVLLEERGSEDIGFFASGIRFGLSPCVIRLSRTLHCVWRDPDDVTLLRFRPPSGFTPEGFAGHLSMPAPHLEISRRSAHLFRRSPHTPEVPNLRVKVRIQGFSPSLRLTPPSASRVYFTPLTPFGFTLQGFPLPRSHTNSSLVLCRLAVIPRLRSHHLE